ncbi:MAG: mannitol dehydrogenase family protein [Spirochaetaceae bacterium]|jgi:fructuronate reductase|nr:mannitol dehydrogenase family protein [Spirochaetaceae bacterium]
MLELTKNCLKARNGDFEKAGVRLPDFDMDAVRDATRAAPVWVHFGVGNLFKAYHASLAQRLIECGAVGTGVIAVVPNDFESVDSLYRSHDNLILRVVMKADGALLTEVIGSVTDVIGADTADAKAWDALKSIFAKPSLQIVSLAITEKGYDLKGMDGGIRPEVAAELDGGLLPKAHVMLKLCALLHERYSKGAAPLALVSTDNFSHNGDRLKAAITLAASEWRKRGVVGQGFVDYLNDVKKVAFPLSMIDKITPYPSQKVAYTLEKIGFSGMEIKKSPRGSVTAAFVNTEEAEYLVIEDVFPNGRPPLEKAGVYFTTREVVDMVERMKVCTCLNPLHTALAVFGCLLGYTSIAAEMGDADLSALVNGIAYKEGMPVVTDPGIIKPEVFVKEVLTVRFPNPNIPDTPQRIATDTSQKLGIRFGETIKLYVNRADLDVDKLTLIPLVIAAWCRYLLGLNDEGEAFEVSPDPLLPALRESLAGVELGRPETAKGRLRPILSNEKVFAVNLYEAGLAEKVERYFEELLAGKGAVRKTLRKYL